MKKTIIFLLVFIIIVCGACTNKTVKVAAIPEDKLVDYFDYHNNKFADVDEDTVFYFGLDLPTSYVYDTSLRDYMGADNEIIKKIDKLIGDDIVIVEDNSELADLLGEVFSYWFGTTGFEKNYKWFCKIEKPMDE